MTAQVHPTALVDSRAVLGPDVVVGPYSIIGPDVVIGESAELAAHVIVERNASIGRRCYLGYGSVVGAAPQDIKYQDEPTRVEIGDETRLREYVTVHRGTSASGVTRVGDRCFLMSYVHVAHDCALGNDVTIANAVQLAGHVTIGDHVTIGGLTPIHQFVRIGRWAFVGGGSRVPQDIPPFALAADHPLRLCGINRVGLERAGFDDYTRKALQHAFRLLFNSRLTRAVAVAQLESGQQPPEVHELIEFFGASSRGVLVG